MEYIFSDTRKELPETYEYIERVEDYLGQRVTRLNADLGFDHWYEVYGGMIPSNHRRWCTKMLKAQAIRGLLRQTTPSPTTSAYEPTKAVAATSAISPAFAPSTLSRTMASDPGRRQGDPPVLRRRHASLHRVGSFPLRLLLLLLPATHRVGTPERNPP